MHGELFIHLVHSYINIMFKQNIMQKGDFFLNKKHPVFASNVVYNQRETTPS